MSGTRPSPTVTSQPGAEAVLEAVAEGHFSQPDRYHLQLQAEHLLLATEPRRLEVVIERDRRTPLVDP